MSLFFPLSQHIYTHISIYFVVVVVVVVAFFVVFVVFLL